VSLGQFKVLLKKLYLPVVCPGRFVVESKF
jgi:hypothetical protein